ncbi:hypothetical protein [Streptomyces sp. cmx-18-6]|uniref:hypothetical protein n=1 Tax=Streptomyces sp. cmx-18-6 TaxID=2790930 RepID=UPI0039802A79
MPSAQSEPSASSDPVRRVLRLGALSAAVLCAAGLLSACAGEQKKADLAEQDRFLRQYVALLNESDEDGLAGLLDDHPHGKDDARARIGAYGGQKWDVTWSRTSDFANVWQVRLTGTAGAAGTAGAKGAPASAGAKGAPASAGTKGTPASAGAGSRPVEVVETVSWEGEHWLLTPLDGVVPRPSDAADTTPPQ